MRPYEKNSEADLRGLLQHPAVGELAKERIRAELTLRETVAVSMKQIEDSAIRLGIVDKPKPRRGSMNKTETAFLAELRAQFGPDEPVRFEAIKLRLADGAWYTPDFAVTDHFYEVKGHWREAARVRIKVAAKEFPEYKFIAVQKRKAKDGGGWKYEAIGSRERDEWLDARRV